uniref:Delta-12 fatty acid desaturase 2 n=1 Tax=Mortierella isabellina TaxID=91625 RepID=A0A0K2FPZ7_MORIS|nr:delta-12 fatty acid desaturase 2 [Umbelopsis isabellina]
MATRRNIGSGNANNKQPVTDEAAQHGWEVPNFSIKEIREAIPAHCFERDTLRSFSYVAYDLSIIAALAYAASFIDTIPYSWARVLLWPCYWVAQGIVATGVWVLAHECGHQAFSPSKFINNSVGFVLHTALLVPYHSWRISHSRHHKATGHMTRDQVFVPSTRSSLGLPKMEEDPEGDGPHHILEEAPLYSLFGMIFMFTFGWPLYLLINVSGQNYPGWASHYNPWCTIYEKHQVLDVIVSDLGIVGALAGIFYATQVLGPITVLKYYFIPYLGVNFWLVLITYLQHTDPKLPHYREGIWNFQRGAALTVDRDYGFLINHLHHHIADTHVAHHFFSTMPHYNAQEATRHIKKVLGKHYHFDKTPIPFALWRSYRSCHFVEDEGDVVFWKN